MAHKKNNPNVTQPLRPVNPAQYTDGLLLQMSQEDSASSALPPLGYNSIEELLRRDQQRVKDGFPRKIQIGRMIKPDKSGQNSIVVVPTTVEEKFMHDPNSDPQQEDQMGGTGEGEEGEVIGEQPVRPQEGGAGEGSGEGGSGSHEVESNAYELGKALTEQFSLPNLRDKGTKRSLTKYTWDITDTCRGFGQVLDKKATLKNVIATNIALGKIDPNKPIDPQQLLIGPRDKMYRILSQEKEYESQALVFFLRDYSSSMTGKCTELVVAQHVMIYSWLLYQYSGRVETKFVVHDTEAREVPDFYSYYNSKVAGGTQVAAAYKFVNEAIETNNYAQDYNIYVFQGTDGDDWDTSGERTVPELKRLLQSVARIGITIAAHSYTAGRKTEVQKYLEHSELLKTHQDLLRLDVIEETADESRLLEGIKKLIAQEVVH